MSDSSGVTTSVAGRVAGIGVVVATALLLLPDVVLLDRFTPFAQLVAFRPAVLTTAAAVLAVPVVVLLVRRRARWFVVAVLGVLVVGGGQLVPRLVPDGGTTGPELTVLAVNVYDGRADVDATVALLASAAPALVSIPEAGAEFRSRLAPLVEPLGYRLYGSTGADYRNVDGVTALARADLGELRMAIDDSTPFRSVVLTGGALGELRFVAFHSIAPVPSAVVQWRSDLAHVTTWCAGPTPAIVAGDFNATLDHSALRSGIAGCGDAADQFGAGLVGTWPSNLPAALGTQIDHVVVTAGISAESFEVHDVPGTDHRAVVTRLRLPARPE